MRSSRTTVLVGFSYHVEEEVIISAFQEPLGLLETLMEVLSTPDTGLSLSKMGQYSHYFKIYE